METAKEPDHVWRQAISPTMFGALLIERGPREIALGPRPIGAKRLSLASYRFVAGRVEKQEVSAHVSSDYGCLQSPGAARLGR